MCKSKMFLPNGDVKEIEAFVEAKSTEKELVICKTDKGESIFFRVLNHDLRTKQEIHLTKDSALLLHSLLALIFSNENIDYEEFAKSINTRFVVSTDLENSKMIEKIKE